MLLLAPLLASSKLKDTWPAPVPHPMADARSWLIIDIAQISEAEYFQKSSIVTVSVMLMPPVLWDFLT